MIRMFSPKLKDKVFFVTAADKWNQVEYLRKNGKTTIFFKMLITISHINKN